MNLRPVKQVLDELVRYVEAPRGVTIFLTESIPSSASDLNWVAIMEPTGVQCNDRFAHKVAGLRKSDPLVDWSGIDEHGGQKRRIIKWVSERTPGRYIPSAARLGGFRLRARGDIASLSVAIFAPLRLSILDQFEKVLSASRICPLRVQLLFQLFLQMKNAGVPASVDFFSPQCRKIRLICLWECYGVTLEGA